MIPRRWLPVALAAFAAGCGRSREPMAVYNTVPEFSLTTQTGADFHFSRELAGKIWVANFIFTNCTGPCPRMSNQMKQVQAAAQEVTGVRLISFTVDPARDTPEVLDAYAKRNGANPAFWYFLTGPVDELHNLARNVFMLGNVTGELDHSTRFVLVDQQGRVRRYYESSEPNLIDDVVADIRALTRETS